MQSSIGLGGPPPAVPELSASHPARFFDALVAQNTPRPVTLTLISKSSHAVDRLLVLFGRGIANQLDAQNLPDLRDKYARQYARMKEIFEEACAHYYVALVDKKPIRLIEGSRLRKERNLDGYDFRQTIILTMQEFLDIEPAPFQLSRRPALDRIGAGEKGYDMASCLQNIWKEYEELYAFLNYTCGMRQVHPWSLARAVVISFEISLFKRELLPGKRAINVLKDWSAQNSKTQEIGRRLFACFSLIPLVDADSAIAAAGPRPGQITLDRCDILLTERETLGHFILKSILENAFETLIGSKSDAACWVFINSYSHLKPTVRIQHKLFCCLEEIARAYSRHDAAITVANDHRNLVQVLQEIKNAIDEIYIPESEPTCKFIHAGLLLSHLSRLLPLSVKQKRDAFDALYAADSRNIYEMCLMPLHPWHEGNRAPDMFSDIEKLRMLTGENLVCLFYHYACDRLNLRPIPPTGLRPWRDEACSWEVSRRFLQDLSASRFAHLDSRIHYYLQDGYYAAPDTLPILERLFEILEHLPPGEEEIAERAFTGLEIVWKSYPFWRPLIQNAESYARMIRVLKESHTRLEELYPNHEHSNPSTPSYDFLLSLLLLCHLARVIALEPAAKTEWFDRLWHMSPAARGKLLQKFLTAHFEWDGPGQPLDLEHFLLRYPDLTEDEKTLLKIQYAFDRRNLRSVRQSDCLDFAQTARLIETVERLARTPLPGPYVVSLLEKHGVPQKMDQCLNRWEAVALSMIHEAPNQTFLPRHLTQAHLECVTEIARIPGPGQAFAKISELLGGILLPIRGWRSYQPFFYLLSQEDQYRHLSRWAAVHHGRLITLNPLRSLWAKMEASKQGNTLILCIVDNSLNTRTVRAVLPAFTPQTFSTFLELSDSIGTEYPPDPIPSHADPSQSAMIRSLMDLKLGTRQALWQLYKGPPSVPQLCSKEMRSLARHGNLYRCKTGFSLVPVRDVNAPLNPKFSILFADVEPKIDRLHARLGQKMAEVTFHRALGFEIAQDEGDISEESGSSPESCRSDSSLGSTARLSVDVRIRYSTSRCLKDVCDPHAGETILIYYEVTLSVSGDGTVAVSDKFFCQADGKELDPISCEDFQERVCWLLAMLKSEWYRKAPN